MTELFHSSAQWVIQYLGWCFREEIEEVFEPGSRPPVGRYAPPPPRRESFYGAKGGRSREGERKGGSRERSQGPARKESFRDNPRKTQKHEQKPPRGSSSAAEFRKNSRKPKTGDEMTQRQTETVLQEVEKALETLRRQPDIQEIRLAPQNSFYRRIQHQKIVDAGFISQSVGEGSDRAVTIQRQ